MVLCLICQFALLFLDCGNIQIADNLHASVSTCLRCGEIYNNNFIAYLLTSLPAKELLVFLLLGTQCTVCTKINPTKYILQSVFFCKHACSNVSQFWGAKLYTDLKLLHRFQF